MLLMASSTQAALLLKKRDAPFAGCFRFHGEANLLRLLAYLALQNSQPR